MLLKLKSPSNILQFSAASRYTCLILQEFVLQHCWLWTLYVSLNICKSEQQRSWMNKMNLPPSCLAFWHQSIYAMSPLLKKRILKMNLFETDSLIEVKVLNHIFLSLMHAKRPPKKRTKWKERRGIFHLRHCSEWVSLCLGQGDLQYTGKDLNERYMNAFNQGCSRKTPCPTWGYWIQFWACVCEGLQGMQLHLWFDFA